MSSNRSSPSSSRRSHDWRLRAACRAHDPELFFPDPADTVTRRAAVKICCDCPVRTSCLQEANRNHEQFGIWGGRERNRHGEQAARNPHRRSKPKSSLHPDGIHTSSHE